MEEKEKPEIKREAKDYLNLWRSEAQNHYRTAKNKAESKKEEKKKGIPKSAGNKVTDFFHNRIFSWAYHYFRSRFGAKNEFLNYTSTEDNGVYKLEKTSSEDKAGISIALVSDWATDTDQSNKIASLVQDREPDYSIHLGDTYFVGMKIEMDISFLSKESCWYRGTSGSFSLLGNHEMYSRGVSYFKDLLPSMGIYSKEQNKYLGQKASYFCLENEHWRIISLDTGYNSVGTPIIEFIFPAKCELEESIMNWLDKTLDLKNDKRGIVILTHHQYCSAFEGDYKKSAEQLASIIGKERNVLWFWGHEHRLTAYGKYKTENGITAYGRCIGHGGMPVEFKEKIKEDKAKECNLVLYDDRKLTKIENMDIGYNGFAMLNINGEELSAEYIDSNDEMLFKEVWISDNQSGQIKGKEIIVNCKDKDFIVYADDVKKAIS
ncbi:MAG: metallophosphoesterase [Bacteroidota bacterium]|nr:metallophosphoesterase [Bacteroidota bacterium]